MTALSVNFFFCSRASTLRSPSTVSAKRLFFSLQDADAEEAGTRMHAEYRADSSNLHRDARQRGLQATAHLFRVLGVRGVAKGDLLDLLEGGGDLEEAVHGQGLCA